MTDTPKKYKLGSLLSKLAKESRSGTLLCVNEGSVQGRIFLQDGRPVMARCRNLRGNAAVELIQQYLLVSFKFYTDQNLVTLDNDEKDITDTAHKDSSPEDPEISQAEYESLLDVSALAQLGDDKKLEAPMTEETRNILMEELAEHIGPLSGILVSELEDGIRITDALNRLAHEIDDVDEAIEFAEKVKARV